MLRMAQNSRQDNLLKKTPKWEGLAISLTGRRLGHIPVYREHPRFQKGISPWKKVNAFFSRGASFLAKVSRSKAKKDPSEGRKAAQRPSTCAIFEPPKCFFHDRQAAKICLSASISEISFVKNSESFFFTYWLLYLVIQLGLHTGHPTVETWKNCEKMLKYQKKGGILHLTN